MMDKVDQILKDFGIRVKELRIAAGVSQEAFAQQAGLDRSYYGRIERSAANPTLRNIASIADALNLPISDLFPNVSRVSVRKRQK